MRTELADLHRRLSATFIYVTHDQSEAMTMSDRVAVMMDGELLQIATPTALYNDPADLRVAEFVGSPRINVIPGVVVSEGTVRVLDGLVSIVAEVPVGSRVNVGMRSECLTLRDADGAATFCGRIRHVENLGSDCFVHVAVDGVDAPVVARADGRRADDFVIGASIGVACDPERVLLFDEAGKRIAARPAVARIRTRG